MIKKTTVIHDKQILMDQLPTIDVRVPEYLFIATANARCPKADIFIKEGDYVKIGQVIGLRHGPFFEQPIHSTCSGTYEGLEKHYHRSGKMVDFMKFHNDFQDNIIDGVRRRSDEEIAAMSKDDIMNIIKDAALVGLGGSSFPTYVKLQTNKKIDTILLNGIECEPFLSSDHRLMLEKSLQLIDGIKILQRAFDCKDVRICIKKKYKDLECVYEQVLSWFPDSGITLCKVKNYYPQGWEVAMIKEATGIVMEKGKLPADYGIMNFNVSTVFGIHLSVREGFPVYNRYISVVGDGVAHPCNFSVRIGTPVKYLIEAAGGYVEPEKKKVVILGGPMMGASVPSDDCIATKTVTSIIVLNERKYEENPCVRCGSCVLSCPKGLEPIHIRNAMKHMPVDKEQVKALNPLDCIECGLCTYSCPSKIPLLDFVRRAKTVAKL